MPAKWELISGRWQAVQAQTRKSSRASARASAWTSAAPPTPGRGAANKRTSRHMSPEEDHVEVIVLTAPSVRGRRASTVVPPPSVLATAPNSQAVCNIDDMSRRQSSRRSRVEPADVPPSVLATVASSQSVALSSQSSRQSSRRSCVEPADISMAEVQSESSMGVQVSALSKRKSSRRSLAESADISMADAGDMPALVLAQSESDIMARTQSVTHSVRAQLRTSVAVGETSPAGRPAPILVKRASIKRVHEREPVAVPEEPLVPPPLQKRSSSSRKNSSAVLLERRPSKRLATRGSSSLATLAAPEGARLSGRAAAPASVSLRESSTGVTPLLGAASLGAASFDEEASEAGSEAASEAASEAGPTRRSSRRVSEHEAAVETAAAPFAAPPLRFPPPPRNTRCGGGGGVGGKGGGGFSRTPRGGGGPAPTLSYAFPEPPMPTALQQAAVSPATANTAHAALHAAARLPLIPYSYPIAPPVALQRVLTTVAQVRAPQIPPHLTHSGSGPDREADEDSFDPDSAPWRRARVGAKAIYASRRTGSARRSEVEQHQSFKGGVARPKTKSR